MSEYRSPQDRDPTGLFFVPPVKKGYFNDQGCCGPIGIGIVLSVALIAFAGANASDPVRAGGALVALFVVGVVAYRLSYPATHIAPPEPSFEPGSHGYPSAPCVRCGAQDWEQTEPIGKRFGGIGAAFRCAQCRKVRSFWLVRDRWEPVFDGRQPGMATSSSSTIDQTVQTPVFDPKTEVPANPRSDVVEGLRTLELLLADGLITPKEYAEKRAELLGRI